MDYHWARVRGAPGQRALVGKDGSVDLLVVRLGSHASPPFTRFPITGPLLRGEKEEPRLTLDNGMRTAEMIAEAEGHTIVPATEDERWLSPPPSTTTKLGTAGKHLTHDVAGRDPARG